MRAKVGPKESSVKRLATDSREKTHEEKERNEEAVIKAARGSTD